MLLALALGAAPVRIAAGAGLTGVALHVGLALWLMPARREHLRALLGAAAGAEVPGVAGELEGVARVGPRSGGEASRGGVARQRMAVATEGRAARTQFRRERGLAGPASLFHAELFTGRTHQIRVHLSHLGHPLVGDTLYGGKTNADIQRQALHAHKLGFIHPMTGETCEWQLPLPSDIRQAVSAMGLSYN